MRGLGKKYWDVQKMAKREKEIIAGNHFFMGRTEWDRAYLRAINPSANYYHENRILREAFWEGRWEIGQIRRHRIVFTNAGHPRKGIDTLIDAVKLLQSEFPDIQIGIVGRISRRSGYGRYVRRRMAELGHIVVELGELNANEIVKELLYSHVFVSSSFIENNTNAVCEAQLLGMPVVSTYTGGVPSIIEEGQTGLFFPTGDAPILASRLRELFLSDDLATQLGSCAREVAVRRHDPDAIVRQVVAAYEDILRQAN